MLQPACKQAKEKFENCVVVTIQPSVFTAEHNFLLGMFHVKLQTNYAYDFSTEEDGHVLSITI